MEDTFKKAVKDYKKANDDINSRIRNNYKSMIKYYIKVGDGKISKYAGVIINKQLIDVFIKRYIELGGSMSDLID
tara:strand:+ start:163 stop:387 length:225 start_codon:yes stop_codon:yes gene_type:complete